VLKYARNVQGWTDAEHGETAPHAERTVISPLSCALVETTRTLRLFPGSRIAAYGAFEATEGFHCRYGMNVRFQQALLAGPLRACADDETGEIRAVELDGHPFFVATLFQPERAALQSRPVQRTLEASCPKSTLRACSSINGAGLIRSASA
jgi:CTP synthase (UTP-ammonia lyase)